MPPRRWDPLLDEPLKGGKLRMATWLSYLQRASWALALAVCLKVLAVTVLPWLGSDVAQLLSDVDTVLADEPHGAH